MHRYQRVALAFLLASLATDTVAAPTYTPIRRASSGRARKASSKISRIIINEGVSSLARDGTEGGGTNYNSFPGGCDLADGTVLMPFRDAANHGVDFNNATIDIIRSTNSGLSWQDQTQEVTVVAASANYDPYSPSCLRLPHLSDRILLKYEKVWTSPYPAGTTIATTAVTVTANEASAVVANSSGWQVGMIISTTGHTTNAVHVAITQVPDSTHINYPLVAANGPLADGVGTIQTDMERTVHYLLSTDNTATAWGAELTNNSLPAQAPFVRYVSAGGPPVIISGNALLDPNYFRQYNQLRYTSFASRSTDNGTNWTFRSFIAQDPNAGNSTTPGNWGFQFEEPYYIAGTSPLQAIIRVDDSAGTNGDNALDAYNFTVTTSDEGVSHSAYAQAFAGNGWPACSLTTDNIRVCMTRDNLDRDGLVNRPSLWVSRTGSSWQGPLLFGDDSVASPRYMYGWLGPHPTKLGVIRGVYGQEVTLNNADRLAYAEFGVNASAQIPAYRSTRSALWGNANTSYVTYDSDTFLNGSTSAVFLFRIRYIANAGGTQNLFSRGTLDAQERFRMTTGNDFEIGFATAATTYATETYNDTVFPLNQNACAIVLFDGANVTAADRARLWYGAGNANPAEDTTPDVTSGTMPSSLRTSATNFWLGASLAAAGSNPRQVYIGELVIWANPNVATAVANMSSLCAQGVSFDYATSALGAPSVWLRLDGDFTDSRGILDNPVVTGADITHSNLWTFGGGYLAP